MKRLFILALGLYCSGNAFAQDDIQPFGYFIDALRFSQTSLGGTTRMQSMGGVQVALGGDLSSALSNPAGLGMYNRSDASITALVNFGMSSTDYLGNTTENTGSGFSIAQAGIALQSNAENEGIFLSGTFAITLTRINDFNGSYSLSGTNDQTSIIDSFLEQANGETTQQFGGNDLLSLSYENYLIGPKSILIPPGPDDEYFTDVTGIPNQTDQIRTAGKQNQWSISYGGNFNDKFYLGLGLGILSLSYQSKRIYSENFSVDPLSNTTLTENLTISGTGVNGTLGFIYRPVSELRIGASFISPTLYGIEDTYDATMDSNWNNFLYEDAIDGDTTLNFVYFETDILVSNYTLTTPMKLNGGIAYFFGKNGFISLDATYTDHTNTNMKTDDFSMSDDNQAIQNVAKSTLNIKIGGEYRINNFMFRAGYTNVQNAYETDEAIYKGGNVYSGGFGFRKNAIYADIGLIYSQYKQEYSPYFVSGATPIATVTDSNTRLMITIGFNF